MSTSAVRLLLVGATCLALVSGCSGNVPGAPVPSPSDASAAPPAPATSSPVPDTDTAEIAVRDVIIDPPEASWQDAVTAARRDFPGDLSRIELRQDEGTLEYRIELLNVDTRYAAAYEATNLKRLSEERQELGASAVRQLQKTFDPRSYISLAEAAVVARRVRPGDIAAWKLQGRDTGRVQYEFSVQAPDASRRVNVQLNAEDGSVIAIS